MEFTALRFEERERIAYVTLNRPERLNALNGELVDELRAAAERIESGAAIRAVLLSASGRAFSSGADLVRDDFFDTPGRTLGELVGGSMRERFNPMVSAWYHLPVPVVVAVNGIAAGAGMSLALVGDIVLAARSATFVQLFAPKLGLMPDLGSSFHVPRLIGAARAKDQDSGTLEDEVAEIKRRLPELELEARTFDDELRALLSMLPNLPAQDVPDGADETANVEMRRVGAPRAMGFAPKDHVALGEALGMMDFEAAARLSGARFVVLKGGLARLERALAQLMLDLHTGEFGYTEVSPPVLVRDDALYGTGQLPKFAEDQFQTGDPR